MSNRVTRPAREEGQFRGAPRILIAWLVAFIVLTAAAPLAFSFVPGFWAYVAFAVVMGLVWIFAVVMSVPWSAMRD